MLHVLTLGIPLDAVLAASVKAQKAKLTEAPDVSGLLALCAAQQVVLLFVGYEHLAAVFGELKDNRLSIPVVAVGPSSPAVGAKAIRLGAVEYLTLPMDKRLVDALLSRALAASDTTQGPVSGDPAMALLLATAKQYAASSATVLLKGESGTGKEVMSRFIHQNSPRVNGPFVAVNCAAIPENLLESELFGHEKGSFSGALTKRIGKFQQANGGTLLLDEISEMDLGLQAKLLRAIQERVIDPIGSESPVEVDIRLIATTNRKLEDYVAEGKFREDLYFRLSVVMLDLLPLRERPGDILPLAAHFAASYAKANGFATVPVFSEEAQAKLLGCYWKGNVRELENTVQRAILLAGNAAVLEEHHVVISPMSLQQMSLEANNSQAATQPLPGRAAGLAAAAAAAYGSPGGAQAPVFVPKRLADAEKDFLVQTLTFTHGNRDIAADILGISVQVLREKLVTLGLVE